jgi:cytochrome c oxidase subunit II
MTGQPFSITARATPRLAMLAGGLGLSAAIVVLAALAGAQTGGERVVKITAGRYEYSPEVVLKRGEPVILELISHDRLHGFHIAALNVRADVLPGQSVRVRVVPDKIGVFPFTCDLFCGSGHNDMSGVISVTD